MEIMRTIAVVLVVLNTDVQATCLGINSNLDQTKIATMCKSSVVTGTQVFIDTDLATNTTLSTGVVCSCNVQAQGGRRVKVNSLFGGIDNTNCGTSAEFMHASYDYILGTPCYDHDFTIPTITHTNISVSIRKTSLPGIATYCVAMNLETSLCTDNQFECNNGQCIDLSQRCDGLPNCDDDSDEESCSSTVCSEDQKKCETNDICVSPSDWCNGVNDCPDGSDESAKNCDPNFVATTGAGAGTTPSSNTGMPLITVTCLESNYLPQSTTPATTTTSTTAPTTTTTTTPTTTTTTPPTTTSTATTSTTTQTTTTPTTTSTTIPSTSKSTTSMPSTTTSTTTTPSTTSSTTTTTPTTTTTSTTTSTSTSTTSLSTTTSPTSSSTTSTSTTSPSTGAPETTTTEQTTTSSVTTKSTTPPPQPTTKTTTERYTRTTPPGELDDDDDDKDNKNMIIIVIVIVLAIILIFLAIIYFVRNSSCKHGQAPILVKPDQGSSINSYSNGAFVDSPDMKELPDVYTPNTPTHTWVPVEESTVHITYGPSRDYMVHQ